MSHVTFTTTDGAQVHLPTESTVLIVNQINQVYATVMGYNLYSWQLIHNFEQAKELLKEASSGSKSTVDI